MELFDRLRSKISRFGATLTVVSLFFLMGGVGQAAPVLASSIGDLTRTKQLLAQQAEQARQAAAAKAAQAAELKVQLDKVATQITQSQGAITATSDQIDQTLGKISDLENQIAVEESNLDHEKVKMADVISSWYMEDQAELLEAMLSANNISDAVDVQENYDSLRQQIETTQDTITKARDELNRQKNEKNNQLQALSGLKNDQIAQKNNLEANKKMKNRLLNDTTNTIADLNNQEQQAQARIKVIDAQIAALSATQTWGTQIVSSNDSSWYYMQTGNGTHLGNSPYTVSQYGCLVTSMAMVATYYGHQVTPTDIASNTALFDRNGYLMVSSPPGIGVNILPSQSINWATVEDELANNHPVIVSIYLPSVGAVNSDGSSHFIVIKGMSGDKYLMHDPIGAGRGYNMNQVRSMKLVRDL